jgi:hypothetical protein
MYVGRIIGDFLGISFVLLGVAHISMIGPTILNVPMIIVGICLAYFSEIRRRRDPHYVRE